MQPYPVAPALQQFLAAGLKGVGNGRTNFIRFFLFTSFAFKE